MKTIGLTLMGFLVLTSLLIPLPVFSQVQDPHEWEREPIPLPQVNSIQSDCDYSEISTNSTSWMATGSIVTITNGTAAKMVVILEFSAECRVSSAGGLLILGHSVDGGSVHTAGPLWFCADTTYDTHTKVWPIGISPGTHKIQVVYSSNSSSNYAYLFNRCLTVRKGN